MGIKRSYGAVMLCGRRDAVDQHMMVEYTAFCRERKLQILILTRVEMENCGQFHRLGVGNSVGIDRRSGKDTYRRQISMLRVGGLCHVLLPRILRQGKQTRIARALVTP